MPNSTKYILQTITNTYTYVGTTKPQVFLGKLLRVLTTRTRLGSEKSSLANRLAKPEHPWLVVSLLPQNMPNCPYSEPLYSRHGPPYWPSRDDTK